MPLSTTEMTNNAVQHDVVCLDEKKKKKNHGRRKPVLSKEDDNESAGIRETGD